MSQGPQIDFRGIAESNLHEAGFFPTNDEFEAIENAIREGIREAIRLAAPLFAEAARTKTVQGIVYDVEMDVIDTASIIDAVESVTLKIVGK